MIVKFSLILKLKILIINKKRPMAATIRSEARRKNAKYYHIFIIIPCVLLFYHVCAWIESKEIK